MEEKYFKAGRLTKTFGLKGHLRGFIEPLIIARIKKLESIFLLSKNTYIPYFIDELDISESGHCMFHFEEIKDKTAADQVAGKDIYMLEKQLKKAKAYATLADYTGFEMSDEVYGSLGKLEAVIEFPGHAVGQFTYSGHEVLFPWNDHVIIAIDKRKKTIIIHLPDGLLDVYL